MSVLVLRRSATSTDLDLDHATAVAGAPASSGVGRADEPDLLDLGWPQPAQRLGPAAPHAIDVDRRELRPLTDRWIAALLPQVLRPQPLHDLVGVLHVRRLDLGAGDDVAAAAWRPR